MLKVGRLQDVLNLAGMPSLGYDLSGELLVYLYNPWLCFVAVLCSGYRAGDAYLNYGDDDLLVT